jgi:predicted amidohydrolase
MAPVLGDLDENIQTIERLLTQTVDADLLVLPELCHCGYRFESRDEAWALSENIGSVGSSDSFGSSGSFGPFVKFLKTVCETRKIHIVAGVNERDGDKLYNSSVLVGPDGLVGTYRKLHLFMDEKDIFEPGDIGLPVFDIGVCKIGMLICFDWVFPEAWRILALKGADIICHPSNLIIPGLCQKALPVHAVCNRVFVVTANRIGTERDLTFTGLSTIADPRSEVLLQASPDKEEVGVVDIDIALARDKNVTPRNNVFDDRRPDMYAGLV